jgi:site-specific DNA-methyltransferase (adenine-specific)
MLDIKIINGNSQDILKNYPDNYFDSMVTDPPYGISFMGKKWDYDVPKVEFWKEAIRVLKSGAHILVACGTRTQHRMAVNIEDAGFEIRDVITMAVARKPTSFRNSLLIIKNTLKTIKFRCFDFVDNFLY